MSSPPRFSLLLSGLTSSTRGWTPVLGSRMCGDSGGGLAQSQVSLGDGFKIVSVYSALLGSNMDTSLVSVYGVFHILFVNWCILVPEVDSRPALCLCILRCAWFDSGYMRCVSLRSISYS